MIAATFVLSAAATAAAAWRWSIIAGRLGVGLRFPEAVGMYYRSQFLNTVLPGGVVGDVQRAVAQGRNAGNVAQAARAVVIERTVGQVVQIALAVIVLAWFGLEFEGYLLPALGIGLTVLARRRARNGRSERPSESARCDASSTSSRPGWDPPARSCGSSSPRSWWWPATS